METGSASTDGDLLSRPVINLRDSPRASPNMISSRSAVPTSVALQVSTHSGVSPTPDNLVSGNCGYSWLDLAKK
jgi:hypothetical protein